ncbi:MAG: hypothetical protein ACKO1I_02105 [Microcystis aeruginosa]
MKRTLAIIEETNLKNNDSLIGGDNNDNLNEGLDTITDFNPTGGNADTIQVSTAGFGGGLTAADLLTTQFQFGAEALLLFV